MIIAMALGRYEKKEIQIVDTALIKAKYKKIIEDGLNKEDKLILIEMYSYSAFYNAVKLGFIAAQFPITIEDMLFVDYYKEEEGFSW